MTLSLATTMRCEPFTVDRIDAYVLRWPVRRPVRTSFGTMHDRPAVLVRIGCDDGTFGWGEIWCNFPAFGAAHRASLLETVFAPLVTGRRFESPTALYDELTARTAVLAIQCGEPGPMSQVIAGIDLAMWDLVSRRAGVPLWRYLGGGSDAVQVYASGINPERPEDMIVAKRAEGYRAFKLKVGFGEARDVANVTAVRSLIGSTEQLLLDANQAWDPETAIRMAAAFEATSPGWLEEPLRADAPSEAWRRVAQSTGIPLAAGENLIGDAAFTHMIDCGALGVVQPDLAKWGGISGCLPVIERIHAAGLRYCPHFLGAGIGQLASAHVLAARGSPDELLEIDANENPLRTVLSPSLDAVRDGWARLGDTPGLGVEPDLAELQSLCRRSAMSPG